MKKQRIISIILVLSLVVIPAVCGAGLQEHWQKAAELYKAQDYEGAIVELRAALDILKKQKAMAKAQLVQMNIGINFMKLGQYQEAADEFDAALALLKKTDPKMDIRLTKLLGTAYQNLGRYALRIEILEALQKRHPQMPEDQLADVLASLGDSYRRSEVHSKAVACYRKAAELFQKLNKPERQAPVLTAMALSQSKLSDFDQAIKTLEQALKIAEKFENKQNLAETLSNLGIVYWDKGEYVKALDYILQAKKVEDDNKLKGNLTADYNNEGLIYKSVGYLDRALPAIEMSIELAREEKNAMDEAIALSNRGLIYRLQGKYGQAMADYQAALKLYETVKFMEGEASCHLGVGKLQELDKQDYQAALAGYEKARDMYRQLGSLAYEAEALNEIGNVLQKGLDPARTSRDLMFVDDEPVFIKASPKEALSRSLEAYQQALKLSRMVGKKEQIWTALRGIGFAYLSQGRLEEALKYYREAIETVINIRGGSDSQLMANYLNDKADLFTEAIELLTELYSKTKKEEYLRLQMEYQEIYKNEVMKVALQGVDLKYDDPKKADLMSQIKEAMAKKDKLDQLNASQQGALAAEAEDEKEKADLEKKKKVVAEENKFVVKKAEKLEGSIKELLAKWKKQYPGDAGLFDSSAKVNIASIQKNLGSDQALIQYFPLDKKLSILCVTQKEVKSAAVEMPYQELASLIRDKFTYENIELYGHMKTDLSEQESFKNCNDVLHKLYQVLIDPVAEAVEDKQNLIIVPSKYIGYVPFAALVAGYDSDGQPHFLVYDKTISYIRLSFFEQVFSKKRAQVPFAQNRLIAVGNPVHKYLKAGLGDLPGAEKEINEAMEVAEKKKMKDRTVLFTDQATETAWRKLVTGKAYTIFYFATHGVPFAEIVHDRRATIGPYVDKLRTRIQKVSDKKKKTKYEKTLAALEAFEEFCARTFKSKSPLNGFLYMAYSGEEKDDGVLTLQEILEMPEASFKGANLAILSACNTAVTYSPKVDEKIRKETESEDINKELMAAGWTPGVDQVCLTDTFMRRNFNSVMGTLWFADDLATGFIIARFFENLAEYAPAEALRQAQLAYLKNPPMGSDYTKTPRHPYYWAVSGVFGR